MKKGFGFKKMLAAVGAAGLVAVASTAFAADVPFPADPPIQVDQVGYLTGYKKIAMVTLPDATKFKVVDVATGKTEFEGNLSSARFDAMSEENVRTADFTSLKKAGTYKIVVDGKESYEFKIGPNVYEIDTIRTLRSYTLSRCNNPLNDSVTGLVIEKGHPQDAEAELYFEDKLNKKGEKFDMSGGWYDAGDYGKYTTTAAFASTQLLLAYDAHPKNFSTGQMFFPQGVKSDPKMPDVLNEVKYELDWMMKMQRKDGSTFHKVSGLEWPSHQITPDTDTQTRYIFSTCSAASAMYGATMALASRVYKPYDPEYSKKLLERAIRAWDYIQATPESVYRVDEGQEGGSGPYDDKDDVAERAWLAAELFKTTGDKQYESYLKLQQVAKMTSKADMFWWGDMQSMAQYAYATSKGADKQFQDKVKTVFIGLADDIVKTINSDGYRCALTKDQYTWASAKNTLIKGDLLLMAYQLKKDPAYLDGALDQIHYMLGRNSLNKSFLTGAGTNPPEHPHNRIHESTGAYVPGLLVGGPNAVVGGDPDQEKFLKENKVPVAKSYLDVLMSWSTNEYAIDYTSAAAYALAWFSKPDSNLTTNQIRLTRNFPPLPENQKK